MQLMTPERECTHPPANENISTHSLQLKAQKQLVRRHLLLALVAASNIGAASS